MLPPDTVVRAASRWLRILRSSTLSQAWSLIGANANYTDLTQTQYALALDWLRAAKLISPGPASELSPAGKNLPYAQVDQLLFERSLELAAPAWLPDADRLARDGSDLPQDAANLAVTLGLSEAVALVAVKRVHGRVELAHRDRVGMAGEQALVRLLERNWPVSTVHVSLTDDGFGYDILFRHGSLEWHLEVKSTTRRGRLVIYLSRHEHEVGLVDPSWRLIVVGLDSNLEIRALATVRRSAITDRAPKDSYASTRWQSASYQLTSKDLDLGLGFIAGQTSLSGVTESFLL